MTYCIAQGTQYFIITHKGKESEKEYISVCVCVCVTESLCSTPKINMRW